MLTFIENFRNIWTYLLSFSSFCKRFMGIVSWIMNNCVYFCRSKYFFRFLKDLLRLSYCLDNIERTNSIPLLSLRGIVPGFFRLIISAMALLVLPFLFEKYVFLILEEYASNLRKKKQRQALHFKPLEYYLINFELNFKLFSLHLVFETQIL